MAGKKAIIFLVIGIVILKILLSFFLELGNDEVYYIRYAKHLQLNYFDHPPMVGLILKICTLNLYLKSEIFLRLGFIIAGGISSWIIYRIATKLYNPRAGFISLLLFTASAYANIISGFMMMPDGPLLLFFLLAAFQAIKIVQQENTVQSLLLFGLYAGLAVMSKVSAAVLWIGMAGYIILFDRAILKNYALYLGIAISIIIASPIVWWDNTLSAAGASYHAGRVTISRIHFSGFLRQLLGEVGYNNPVCYVLTLTGALYVVRKKIIDKKLLRLILCLSLPLILMVYFFSFFRDTLPHWTGPSFALLSVLGGIRLSDKMQQIAIPKIVYWANGFLAFILFCVPVLIYCLPVSFNSKSVEQLGKGDILLDMSGWKQFGHDFNALYEEDEKRGVMKPGAYLLSEKWFPASHLNWYVADQYHYPFLATGALNNLHQYAWANENVKQMRPGSDAYMISVSNYYTPVSNTLLNYFETAEKPVSIFQKRMGKNVRRFTVTRLHGYKGGIPASGVVE